MFQRGKGGRMTRKNPGCRPIQTQVGGSRHTKIKHCKICNWYYVDVGGGHTCPEKHYVDSKQGRAKGRKQARYPEKK